MITSFLALGFYSLTLPKRKYTIIIYVAVTPAQMEEYCKRLIDEVGEGGGFMIEGALGVPDEARPENVKVMTEVTKKYGVYRK
ncbi:MAG: hypothetical protein ACETWM_22620 [Candidatus Lokiarchaeia archaeon]